jgi:hypothetical protein
MNREVLEKLCAYIYARPFAQLALRFRDLDKKIQALNAQAESDGRMRSSYNVGATETGRWSSSKGAFGGGLNDQTWTKELRELFVADDGYELFQSDLEQAEARAVAYLAQDEKFIAACESGDLWTFACKLIWPGLDWSGKLGYTEDLAADKQVAEQKFLWQSEEATPLTTWQQLAQSLNTWASRSMWLKLLGANGSRRFRNYAVGSSVPCRKSKPTAISPHRLDVAATSLDDCATTAPCAKPSLSAPNPPSQISST